MITRSYTSDTATGWIEGTAACQVSADAYTEARANIGPTGQCHNTTSFPSVQIRQEFGYHVPSTSWLWWISRGYISFDTSVIGTLPLTGACLFISSWDDAEVAGSDVSDILVYNYDSDADLCGAAVEANYDGAYGGTAVLEGTIVTGGVAYPYVWYHTEVAASNINVAGSTTYTLVSNADVSNDSSKDIGELHFVGDWPYWPYLQLDVPGGFAWIF